MDPDDVPRRAEPSPVAAPTSSAADLTGAVRVTDLLGHQVLGVGGARLGRLEDLTILHGDARPEVHRVLLRDAGERRALDGDLVELVDGPSFTTRHTPGDLEVRRDTDVATTELRLGADVLDAQIVDLTGHHLVRVGDVLIADIDGRILVVGVEVDVGAVLRRLGLRRLARRVPARVVPWDELHLASRRGHEVQLEARSAHLDRCSALDLAHLLARLRVEHATDILEQAPQLGADALAVSHDEVGRRLLASLPEPTAEQILSEMPAERADEYRSALQATHRPRRRFRRLRGWSRHAPVEHGG